MECNTKQVAVRHDGNGGLVDCILSRCTKNQRAVDSTERELCIQCHNVDLFADHVSESTFKALEDSVASGPLIHGQGTRI